MRSASAPSRRPESVERIGRLPAVGLRAAIGRRVAIRRRCSLRLMLALLLLALGSTSDAPLSAQTPFDLPDIQGDFTPAQGQLILDVKIVGNRRVSKNQILARLKSRPDRVFDPDLIQADAQELMLMKEFRNVRPYVNETPEGVIVTFEVSEKSRIEKIEYVGNRAVFTRTLAKETGLKVGDPLDLYAIRQAKERIEDYYHRKGFPRTEVTIVEGNEPTDSEVIFLISEDRIQKIEEVDFVGNAFVSGSRLTSFVKSKPGMFAPIYHNRYVADVLAADRDKLTAYYRRYGFFRARVDSEVEYNDDHSGVMVRFVVDEGPRYRVRNISFAGNQIYSTEDLFSLIEMQVREDYDGNDLERDTNTLKDLYGANGYIQSTVEPEILFLEEPGWVDLVYKIEEGEQYRVGRINVNISGEYGITKQSVVLARLGLRPGDIVDIRQIRDSERRLGASGLFLTDPGQEPRIEVRPSDDEFRESTRSAFRSQSPDGTAEVQLDLFLVTPPPQPEEPRGIRRILPW